MKRAIMFLVVFPVGLAAVPLLGTYMAFPHGLPGTSPVRFFFGTAMNFLTVTLVPAVAAYLAELTCIRFGLGRWLRAIISGVAAFVVCWGAAIEPSSALVVASIAQPCSLCSWLSAEKPNGEGPRQHPAGPDLQRQLHRGRHLDI